jgi:hypothetical protein
MKRLALLLATAASALGATAPAALANDDHFTGECISPTKVQLTSYWAHFPNRKNTSDVRLTRDSQPAGHELVHWTGASFQRSYDVAVTPGTHRIGISTTWDISHGLRHASQTFTLACSKPQTTPPPKPGPSPAPTPSQQQQQGQQQQQTTTVINNNTIIVQAPPTAHHTTKLVNWRTLIVFARHGTLRYVRVTCGGRLVTVQHTHRTRIRVALDLRGLGRTVRLHVVIRTSTGKRIFITIDVHRTRGGTIKVDP